LLTNKVLYVGVMLLWPNVVARLIHITLNSNFCPFTP
jgi:hypothetical protein